MVTKGTEKGDVSNYVTGLSVSDKKLEKLEYNLLEFKKKFPNEEACKKYLHDFIWPKGFKCPKCKHTQYYFHKDKKLYECKECRLQSSLTSKTIFKGTRTPLEKWFLMIFILVNNLGGERTIRLFSFKKIWPSKDYKTIWVMAQKIKKAMRRPSTKDMIAGIASIKSIEEKDLKKKEPVQFFLKKRL